MFDALVSKSTVTKSIYIQFNMINVIIYVIKLLIVLLFYKKLLSFNLKIRILKRYLKCASFEFEGVKDLKHPLPKVAPMVSKTSVTRIFVEMFITFSQTLH